MRLIRKAVMEDIDAVTEIFEHVLDEEEKGNYQIGWVRNVYPTRETAKTGVKKGDLFVLEDGKKLVAAARINQEQMPQYRECRWNYESDDSHVMILHTLVVEPSLSGHGYGTEFVNFYENYARESGCLFLRMDTNEKNTRARSLYAKLGYTEAGIIPGTFNGIPHVHLVCLEKKLEEI